GVGHISFTGSRHTGLRIAADVAQRGVPLLLELGGKSPQIVFADADLPLALPRLVGGITQYAGQVCNAGSRVLVAEEIADSVVASLKERIEAIELGPASENPGMGPLASADQLERVASMVASGLESGRTLTGGRPRDLGGG